MDNSDQKSEKTEVKTLAERLYDAEQLFEERNEKVRQRYNERRIKDIEASMKVLDEQGIDYYRRLKMPSMVEGLPVLVVVKKPSSDVYKRYQSRIHRAKKDKNAVILDTTEIASAAKEVSASVIVYPDKETFNAMCLEWESLRSSAGFAAIKLQESEDEELGNG